MEQQLTIKQIAQLAGVSVGTVDRVLHNRGKVSDKALAAVQAVLDTQSYRYNIHTSAVAFKKTGKSLHLLISIPSSEKGEYWDLVRQGLDKALREYGDISIVCDYFFFDQFSSLSCRDVFHKVASQPCSAVILGTTFIAETRELCWRLDERGVPYVFVDGSVPGTNPVGRFMVDQNVCGRLLARLMDGFTPDGSEIAVLLPRRIGTQISNNSALRLQAFKDYFAAHGSKRIIKESFFPAADAAEASAEIVSFLEKNPKVRGIAVVISAGYRVADAVPDSRREGLVIGGFDVTEGNSRCILAGTMDFLINQHPDRQGFCAVESLLHFLLYGAPDKSSEGRLPIDIVFKENLMSRQAAE